jgi:hypothetical protein
MYWEPTNFYALAISKRYFILLDTKARKKMEDYSFTYGGQRVIH